MFDIKFRSFRLYIKLNYFYIESVLGRFAVEKNIWTKDRQVIGRWRQTRNDIEMNCEVTEDELDETCTPNLRQKYVQIYVGKPQRTIQFVRRTCKTILK